MIDFHRNDKKAFIYGFKDGKQVYINFMYVNKNDTQRKVLGVINEQNNTFLNHALDKYYPITISFERMV